MGSPPVATSAVASPWPLLVLGLLALAAACSSGSAPKESTVPFMVCQSSQTWTRPSEEEQSERVWHGPFGFRYDNWDPAELRDTLCEDFFTWSGGNSELFDKWPLHGLWTAEDQSPGDPACEDGGLRLSQGEVISLFLLLREAKQVRLSGDTFYITVEKRTAGFQEIQFPNLLVPAQPTQQPSAKDGPVLNYNLVILDSSGKELARIEDRLGFQSMEGAPVATATQTP
jgi:hypothetical protein